MDNLANQKTRGDKMKTENKVPLDEVIAAFRDIAIANAKYANTSSFQSIGIGEFNDEFERCSKVISRSQKELDLATPSEYNIDSFEKLADAIEESGKYHFNMSTFFYEGNRNKIGYTSDNIFNTSNQSFKCNSGACIAGFASAIAVDWDSTKTSFATETTSNEHWQHIACYFLNIPYDVGTRIFYADSGSIWSFLKPRIEFFDDLEWGEDSDYAVDYGDVDEYNYENLSVSLSSINYRHAVKALRMIKRGELSFDKSFDPFLTDLCVEYVKK